MRYSLLRRGQMAASIAVGLGAITLAGSLPAAASTVAATQAAQPAQAAWAHAIVVDNCRHKPEVLPRKFILTCADANDFLTRLHWASWRSVAFASGFEHINNCKPNCAAGKFHRYRVLVTLWRPRLQAHHHGLRHFTRLTVLYQGRRPLVVNAHGKAHHPQTVTWRL